MKEFEFIEDKNSIDRIYDLELIQNKYAGVGFDPTTFTHRMLYRTEDVFDVLYDTEAEDKKGSNPVDYAKVDGMDIRTYMKDLLLKKDIVAPGQRDLDRYCKAFIIYSTTEKTPVVTFEKNGLTKTVYETKGLDHNRDNGTIMRMPFKGDFKPRMKKEIDGFLDLNSPETKRILSNAGIDPTNKEEVKALFVTWFVSEIGKDFNYIIRLDNLSDVQARGMGSKFIKDLESHPILGEGVSRETVKKNLQWYGSLIREPIGAFEREYQIPSSSNFRRNKFSIMMTFEHDFDYATRYAKGLNSYMDRILSNSGQGGPDNVYFVNYRNAFLEGYEGSPKEFARQKHVINFAANMNDLVTLDYPRYRDSKEVDLEGELQNNMKEMFGKTLQKAAFSPKINHLTYKVNTFKNEKNNVKSMDETFNTDKTEKLDKELRDFSFVVFSELNVFDDRKFTLNVDQMGDKDYKKAEEVFDRVFLGVSMIEEPSLVADGKDDIVDYFYYDNVKLSEKADEMIRQKKIPEEHKVRYMKALVLDGLRSGKADITYKTLLYNDGELSDDQTYSVYGKNASLSELEIKEQKYKEDAEIKRKEEDAVWKDEEKKNAVEFESFLDFYKYDHFHAYNNLAKEITNPIARKMDMEGYMRFFSVYLLAEKDITLEQLSAMYHNRDLHGNAAKIEQLVQDFRSDIRKRPVINDDHLTDEEKRENLRWYGSLYRKAMDKVLAGGYSFSDAETLSNANRIRSRSMSAEMQVTYLYTALSNRPDGFKKENNHAFMDGFGGGQEFQDYFDKLFMINLMNTFEQGSLTEPNLNTRFYYRMIREIEFSDRYAGKILNDVRLEDCRADRSMMVELNAVGKKNSAKIFNALTQEEKQKIDSLDRGTVKETYPELYKKTVIAWAQYFPFAEKLLKEAKEYGADVKLTEEQEKVVRRINDIRYGNTGAEKKVSDEARKVSDEARKAEEEKRKAEEDRRKEEERLKEEERRKEEEARKAEEELRKKEEHLKAEEARIKEKEARMKEKEELLKAEEERLKERERREEEERRREEERKAEEEKRRLEEERLKEEERKAEEEKRRLEEERRKEEERKAEEEKRRLEEERRKEEERKAEEEKRRLEEERRKEEERKAEEERRKEEERKAEEERRKEEERKEEEQRKELERRKKVIRQREREVARQKEERERREAAKKAEEAKKQAEEQARRIAEREKKQNANRLNNITGIYDLEIIQNRYVGIGFDPDVISLSALYRAESVFSDIFAGKDQEAVIAGAKVDGTDLRSYMKDFLEKKNFPVPQMKDLDRYCKAFLLFGMTEEKPDVTIELNGNRVSVYELPDLEHGRDRQDVTYFPESKEQALRMDLPMDSFFNTSMVKTKRILTNAGVEVEKPEEIKSLFITWYVSEIGEDFNTLDRLSTMTGGQRKALGARFLRALEEHPIRGDVADAKTVEKNLSWYAGLTSRAMETFEERYRIPSEKSFSKDVFSKGRMLSENSFDFAMEYAGGLNSYLDRILSDNGKRSVSNVYAVDQRNEFLIGYAASNEDLFRQMMLLGYVARLDAFRKKYKGSDIIREGLERELKGYYEMTLKAVSENADFDNKYLVINPEGRIKSKKEYRDAQRDRKKGQAETQVELINKRSYPELDAFNTLEPSKMKERDLYNAERIFDSIFIGLRMVEGTSLKWAEEDGIEELFDIGDRSVASIVEEETRGQELSKDDKAKYMKAQILSVMKGENKYEGLSLIYHTLVSTPDMEGVEKDSDKLVIKPKKTNITAKSIENDIQHYKEQAKKELEKAEGKWKRNEKPDNAVNAIFGSFFTKNNFFKLPNDLKESAGYALNPNMKDGTFMNLFAIYLLAEKDVNLEQLRSMYVNRDKPENEKRIRELTEDFKKDIKSRPVIKSANITEEQSMQNLDWYGKLFRKAMEKAFMLDYTFSDKETRRNAGRMHNFRMSSQMQVTTYCNGFANFNEFLSAAKKDFKSAETWFKKGFGDDQLYEEYYAKAYVINIHNGMDKYYFNNNTKLDSRFYYRMLNEIEFGKKLPGMNSKEVSNQEYKEQYSKIKEIFAAGDKNSKAVFGVLNDDEKTKIVNLENATVKEKYPDLYEKVVTGWAKVFPFIPEIAENEAVKKAEEEKQKEAARKAEEERRKEVERKAAEDKKKAEEEARRKAEEDNRNEINEEKPKNEINEEKAVALKIRMRSRRLEAINLKDFLPDDLSDKELNEIMRRSGIENPTSEESKKFLLLAFFEHEQSVKDQNDRAEYINDLSSEGKKALGRRFIDEVKAHPVLGKVEKGTYPSEKLCVIGNIAWYGQLFNTIMSHSFKAYIDSRKFRTTEGLEDIRNSEAWNDMFLCDRGLKLTRRWRNRGGRNISTKDNPYGVDMGDAFMAGYEKEKEKEIKDREFTPKPGSQPQCNKAGVQRFLYDMNWFHIMQAYHMTTERVLSDKADLQQRAYLKLMTERKMLSDQFERHTSFEKIKAANSDSPSYDARFALMGTYMKASLDMDYLNPDELPEKYAYFSKLSDEDCKKILATPYQELDKDLKDKVDKLMPSDSMMNNRYKAYHLKAVREQFKLAQEGNDNQEIFELDILKKENIDNPEYLKNMSEAEKQKIEQVFELVFGPLYMEEALFEKVEKEGLKMIGSNGNADIATHFGTATEDGYFLFMDGNRNNVDYQERSRKGYQRDELVIMKARTLQQLTRDNALYYKRYQAHYLNDTDVSEAVTTWSKGVKPAPKKEIPVIPLKTRHDELYREEPKKEEPKKEEPKEEDPRVERDHRQSIIMKGDAFKILEDEDNAKEEPQEEMVAHNTVRVKKGPKPTAAVMLSRFLQNKFLNENAPHWIDPKSEDKVVGNRLRICCKRLNTATREDVINNEKFKDFLLSKESKNGQDHKFTYFQRMYNVLNKEEKDEFLKRLGDANEELGMNLDIPGLIAGKFKPGIKSSEAKKNDAKKADAKKADAKNKQPEDHNIFIIDNEPEPIPEKIPAQSRAIYTQTLTNLRKATVMAMYAKQCMGSLEYIYSKDINAKEDLQNELTGCLEEVSTLSDAVTAQDAKTKIESLREKLDQNIDQLANADDPTMKNAYTNLKNFKDIAFADFYDGGNQEGKQKGIIVTEDERSMKSILTDEYPNMCKGMTNEEKGAYALETQKKERSLAKLLKKVRENVKLLENCNKTKEGNSYQFNKMFEAAEKAKNLSMDMPIAEIHSIMSDIMATASIYRHKIASQGIYAGNMLVGKKKGYYRKQAANDLIDLAIEIVEPLNSFTDPYKPVGEQIKPQVQMQIQEPNVKGQEPGKGRAAKH